MKEKKMLYIKSNFVYYFNFIGNGSGDGINMGLFQEIHRFIIYNSQNTRKVVF